MELRQLRYFVRVVQLGSMGRAAADLGVVTSTLSQQVSRLETELATRLLQRTSTGVIPTDAGLAFWHQAQLAIRHADDAVRAAQSGRQSGHVSVGLAPSTSAVLGLPFLRAMRTRLPDIRLHLVESLSGNLASMIHARQLDLAILFDSEKFRRWSVLPLLEERLFLVARRDMPAIPQTSRIRLAQLHALPLILPSAAHGLRALLDSASARNKHPLNIVGEIDGLVMLMDAVRAGFGATIQPGAAVARHLDDTLCMIEIVDSAVRRQNLLVSAPEDEMSPAALSARSVMRSVAGVVVSAGDWPGATLYKS